jgi:hypothetical protein
MASSDRHNISSLPSCPHDIAQLYDLFQEDEKGVMFETACRHSNEIIIETLVKHDRCHTTEKALQFLCMRSDLSPRTVERLIDHVEWPMSSLAFELMIENVCSRGLVELFIVSKCPVTEKIVSELLKKQYIEYICSLLEYATPLTENMFEMVCKHYSSSQTKHILALLAKRQCPMNENGIYMLFKHRFDEIQLLNLVRKGCPLSEKLLYSNEISMTDSMYETLVMCGCPLTAHAFETVRTSYGFLNERAIILIKYNCPMSEKAMLLAYLYSNDAVKTMIAKKGYLLTQPIFENGIIHIKTSPVLVQKLILENRFSSSTILMYLCDNYYYGHVADSCSLIVNSGCNVTDETMIKLISMASYHHVAFELIKKGFGLSSDVFEKASTEYINHGGPGIIIELIRLGCPIGTSTALDFLCTGYEIDSMCLVEMLLYNGSPISRKTLSVVCNQFPHLFDMMLERFEIHTTPMLLEVACENESSTHLAYLVENNCPITNAALFSTIFGDKEGEHDWHMTEYTDARRRNAHAVLLKFYQNISVQIPNEILRIINYYVV